MFGAVEVGRRDYPEMGHVSCAVLVGDAKFGLMEPLGTAGVVAKFLKNRGEGIHHVSLVTDDLDGL